MLEEVIQYEFYTHIEKGDVYEVCNITKMKHPETGEWLDCVIYISTTTQKQWVRSLESFKENFKLVTKELKSN